MSAYTQILYQIVFATRASERALAPNNRPQLFKYIWGILQNNKSNLYRINGVDDHIHILTHLHPTVALSDLVKGIKVASSDFIKENNLFDNFNAWQEGYGAFTYSISAKDNLIEYIKNQEEHHKKFSFRDEYVQLLMEHNIEFDEKYLL